MNIAFFCFARDKYHARSYYKTGRKCITGMLRPHPGPLPKERELSSEVISMQDKICDEFAELVKTVAKLRSPEGCPWDREQTHHSLKQYAIEETYEVVEAIDSGDPDKLEDELGDFLLQVLLHAQIASESGQFDISDVCRRIREKLLRRHPHVFADTQVSGVDEVLHNWEQIKSGEPGYDERKSVLDGIPRSLPALMRASKISRKAAKVGFDWPDMHSRLSKIKEEIDELEVAIEHNDEAEVRDEMGDLLFAVVNVARAQDVDPEGALRQTIDKFTYRFSKIEDMAQKTGRSLHDLTLEEMDEVWNQAKQGNINNKPELK